MSVSLKCKCPNWSKKDGCCMNSPLDHKTGMGVRRDQLKPSTTPVKGLQKAIGTYDGKKASTTVLNKDL